MINYSNYSGFDIIGDIHGHYDKLEALFIKLGYIKVHNKFVHEHRLPIFVGDLIDRGPKQLQTINVVRNMVENEQALCILGNHEFNAISYFTKDNNGQPLRALSKTHKDPHCSFLEEVVDNSATHKSSIQWFKTLPLYIKLDNLCIVHACYDQVAIDTLKSKGLTNDNCLTDELIFKTNIKDSIENAALETICKGPELKLPDNKYIVDKDGKKRHEVRIKWWLEQASNYKDLAIVPDTTQDLNLDFAINYKNTNFNSSLQICIGHYWLKASSGIKKLSDKVVCTDYSVAANGPLVAYRYYYEDNGKFLDNRFMSV